MSLDVDRVIISAVAIVDGMGTRRGDGSYVEFLIQSPGQDWRVRMSLGAAETLEMELHNILAARQYEA